MHILLWSPGAIYQGTRNVMTTIKETTRVLYSTRVYSNEARTRGMHTCRKCTSRGTLNQDCLHLTAVCPFVKVFLIQFSHICCAKREVRICTSSSCTNQCWTGVQVNARYRYTISIMVSNSLPNWYQIYDST